MNNIFGLCLQVMIQKGFIMKVFFDNTPITYSRFNGVGNVGLHMFLALRKYSRIIDPLFLYRKKSRLQRDHITYFKQHCSLKPINYNPYLSLRFPLSGKIIHSTYHFASLLPFRTKIVHIHDTWTLRKNPYQSEHFQSCQSVKMARMLNRADYFTVMSQTVKDELINDWHIDPTRIIVMGYGCPGEFDEEASADGSNQFAFPLSEEELSETDYILTVGRIEYRKNYSHAAKAMARLPHLKWIVIGDLGFQGKHIVNECFADLISSGQLIWLTNVSQSTLSLLYRHAFSFLLPSWEEGFGIPLLEAMSFGIPVITSDRSAGKEVVAEGGYLVNPEKHEESVQFLECLYENPSLQEEYCQFAKERAAKFAWQNVVTNLENFYLSI